MVCIHRLGGATYTKNLVGGVDIRDYNGATWENNINGTTTVNVFGCPSDNWGSPGRLDMQKIALPPEFATQTLVSIELLTTCGPAFQRVVLDGLTVESTGPATLAIGKSGDNVNIYWPAAAVATLQTNGTLASTNWTAYVGPVTNAGGTDIVTIAPPVGNLFFRLKQ